MNDTRESEMDVMRYALPYLLRRSFAVVFPSAPPCLNDFHRPASKPHLRVASSASSERLLSSAEVADCAGGDAGGSAGSDFDDVSEGFMLDFSVDAGV